MRRVANPSSGQSDHLCGCTMLTWTIDLPVQLARSNHREIFSHSELTQSMLTSYVCPTHLLMAEDREQIVIMTNYSQQYTVKPAYVVTSIKGSPALSSHIFWVPWSQIQCQWTCIKGSPVLSSQLSGFPWVTPKDRFDCIPRSSCSSIAVCSRSALFTNILSANFGPISIYCIFSIYLTINWGSLEWLQITYEILLKYPKVLKYWDA